MAAAYFHLPSRENIKRRGGGEGIRVRVTGGREVRGLKLFYKNSLESWRYQTPNSLFGRNSFLPIKSFRRIRGGDRTRLFFRIPRREQCSLGIPPGTPFHRRVTGRVKQACFVTPFFPSALLCVIFTSPPLRFTCVCSEHSNGFTLPCAPAL